MTFWTLTIGTALAVIALGEIVHQWGRWQLRRDYLALMAKSLHSPAREG